MYKELLLSKIKNNRFSKYLRNKFNYNPIFIDTSKINESSIISDSFIWRTDDDYETIFKFSDILRVFLYKKETSARILFYDKNSNFIIEKKINNLNLSNKILINCNYLNGLKSYGYFNIFFENKDFFYKEKIVFSNRCYLGFSKKKNNPSFVHGNTYSVSKNFNLRNELNNFVNISFLKNQRYIIQNSFEDFDFSELFFVNPTSKKIIFSIENKNYYLNKNESQIIKFGKSKIIEIKTNCYWLRPIVFNYKNNYLDVYHS
jgi:hypothetical protein